MKRKLVIFGTGLMAKMAHYYFSRDSNYEVAAFTVNEAFLKEKSFLGLPVHAFESLESSCPAQHWDAFVALGPTRMNKNREDLVNVVRATGYALATYISPSAICGSPVGDNSFVADGAHIHPFAQVGSNLVMWDYALIAHDSVVGDHCYLAPRAVVSTFSTVGNNCVVGTSAVVSTRVKVAAQSLIGATCYISQDTQENGVYGEKTSKFYGAIASKVSIS